MNGRFPIAVHILTLLAKSNGELLSSDFIASSMNINAALVRKEVSNLRNHGLVASKEGKSGGYLLGRSAKQITLADVYSVVKNKSVLGTAKNDPNPDCPIGKQINKNIDSLYADLDETLLTKLSSITLADFCEKFD